MSATHRLAEDPAELPFRMEPVVCEVCGRSDGDPLAVGEDFEYGTTAETFLAFRCNGCGLVYLNPRPAADELPTIYPETYHAYRFTDGEFGFVYRVRRRLEAHRLKQALRHLPAAARVLDVGCGDGFHLKLLQDFGPAGWVLHGIDPNPRAANLAVRAGLDVRLGRIEDVAAEGRLYDQILLIATIEHVPDPAGFLRCAARCLAPGGRVLLVTDNTGTLDFRLFGKRHWGGYHFPRHFTLHDRHSLARLAAAAGLEVERLQTVLSPVNWVYSIRNWLQDMGAPPWLYRQFGLERPVPLGVFTVVDFLFTLAGRGALLRASLRKPELAR